MKKTAITDNWMFWALTLVFIGLIALSAYFYNNEQRKIVLNKYDELYDLSTIKVNQIQEWISERKAEGLFISENKDFSQLAGKYIQDSSPSTLVELQNWIKPIRESHDYCAVFLFDTNKKLYTIFDDDNYKSSIDTPFFTSAFSSGKVEMSDFYIQPEGNVFIDVISSVRLLNNKEILVCLRINPEPKFFPFLQLNLLNYQSAEFFLLKKEKDSVIYLNELRFEPKSAMKLKLPLSRTNSPAVQAVLGKTGVTEGKDYRGAEVIAYIQKLEGTPWYAVNKVDKSDVFKEVNYLLIFLVLVVISILLLLLIIMLIRDMTERRLHEKKLSKLTAHLVDVREKERVEIARDLHDDLGQLLTSIKMNTAVITRELKKKEAGELNLSVNPEIIKINSTIDKSLQGLRRIITILRPVEFNNIGLVSAIQSLISDFKKTSLIDCKFNTNVEEIKMSNDELLSIYRIIQESLTNIARHAKADLVTIDLIKDENSLKLSIQDDGVGFQKTEPLEGSTFGLIGIRERVENLKGSIAINSAPGRGTKIKISIPYSVNGKISK